MVNQLQPIMDRVLIRLETLKKQTDGGVLLTDESQQQPTIGIVENIGEDVKSVKIGDKVYFHIFDELPSLEEGLVVVRERSLLGKIIA